MVLMKLRYILLIIVACLLILWMADLLPSCNGQVCH